MKHILTAGVIVLLILIVLPTQVKAQYSPPYTPYAIRAAYDVDPLLQAGYTGKGVTVAVVNQGIDGTFYSDLVAFSAKYGLPNPLTSELSSVTPFGTPGTNQECPTGETTGDVEFVHAIAPDAKILLILTGVGTNGPPCDRILDGFSYVIDNNAADVAVLSPSRAFWDNNGSARSTMLS
ncbi:MAG TPA: hypothetical protein VJZ32_02590 [Candidatus Bathyarchaeia archaeon]|nr:hypothetical protein [Candidatus Bathyarchaeia archaeon]